MPATRCTCHERDSSYACEHCFARGGRGHMQDRLRDLDGWEMEECVISSAGEPYCGMIAAVEVMENLPKGWDSYKADAPNRAATHAAKRALMACAEIHIAPTAVVPSAIGGIGFRFHNGKAYVETRNTGGLCYLLRHGDDEPTIRCIDADDDLDLRLAMQAVRDHLDSECPVNGNPFSDLPHVA